MSPDRAAVPFCSLCAYVWSQSRVRVVDRRGESLDDLLQVLNDVGIVKVLAEDEAACLEVLGRAGAVPLKQYEAVRAGQADPYTLKTVAKATPSVGDTSAVVSRSTDFHMDGYQFCCDYCGEKIAGVGNMPDIELLSFPTVVEGRFLMFSDLCRAARKMLKAHESSKLEHLTRAAFAIDSRYEDADRDLGDPGLFSVVQRDALGWRFHLGGSVTTSDPMSGFSLSLYRAYVASTVITERLESDTLYVIDQRRIMHRGIRVPGVDGKTELRRALLAFPKECK